MSTLKFIRIAIVAVIMSINFTACGDDNNDKENNNILSTEQLVGQWMLTYEEGWYKSKSFPEENKEWSHIPREECEWFGNFTFRADGTFTEYELDNSERTNGKWAYSNSLLTLIENGLINEPKDLKVVEVSTNKLVLEYNTKRPDNEEYAIMTYQKR